MSKLEYRGGRWIGTIQNDQEHVSIIVSDETFERHLKQYLERAGISTMTYLELKAYVDEVLQQRYEVVQLLQNLDYWRDCGDPEVRLLHIRDLVHRIR